MSSIVLKTISILRVAAGVSSLIVPRHVGPLFGLPMGPEASVFARLFGARDFVLGAYLWKTVRDWDRDISRGSGQDGDGVGVRSGLLARPTTTPARGSDTADLSASSPFAKSDGIPRFVGLEPSQAKTVLVSTVRHNDVATALWLGVACDAIDVVSYAACLVEGNVTTMAGVELGGAAVILTVAGLWQLNVLKRKRTED